MIRVLVLSTSLLLRMGIHFNGRYMFLRRTRHELTTNSTMTLVASRRRGISSGHGLVADQTAPASAQLGRPASAIWLVQYCSALGLRLHA